MRVAGRSRCEMAVRASGGPRSGRAKIAGRGCPQRDYPRAAHETGRVGLRRHPYPGGPGRSPGDGGEACPGEAPCDSGSVRQEGPPSRTGSQLRPGAPSAQLTSVFCARVGRAKPRGLLESARRHDMESSSPVAHLVRPFERLVGTRTKGRLVAEGGTRVAGRSSCEIAVRASGGPRSGSPKIAGRGCT